MLGALDLLASQRAPRISQQTADATYSPKLTREDGKIDWSEPAEVIERKIRAFDPWPGAFSQLSDTTGKSVQIENLSRNSQRSKHRRPGNDLHA